MHEDLLRCILECGTDDLRLLDDIGYDVEEIVEYMLETGQRPTLNRILDEVFRRGVQQLTDMLDEKLRNATKQLIASRWTKKAAVLVGALSCLRPWDDIEWYCNGQDTGIYFRKNRGVYRQYLAPELESVEELMGYSIS